MSPRSPHTDVTGTVAGVSQLGLTLNGDVQAFIEPVNASFAFYADTAVAVSRVLPVAGPSTGGSLVNVSGIGFERLGAVLCEFGSEQQTVNGTVLSAELIQCTSPRITPPRLIGMSEPMPMPEGGQRESVQVSLNGQDFTSSNAMFTAFDKDLVHVSALVPFGGPLAGGTRVVVLGAGFADHNVHCQFGGNGGSLVRGSLLNTSAVACMATATATPSSVTLEVTLNGDTSSHTLTSDGAQYSYYDPSAVRIDSVAPRGGPTNGGTEVVVRGAGFADVGGVFCRFGGNVSAVVAATVRSTSELVCMSPQLWEPSPHLLADDLEYVLVDAAAACCPDPDGYSGRLGSTPNGSAPTPSSCEVGCTALDDCRFFSHSSETASCEFCAECAFDRSTLGSMRSVWHRRGLPRADVRLGLILNGPGATLSPPAALAPTFTYYWPRLLEVSHVVPSGGPVAGGTEVTFFGSGFGSPLGSPLCSFGWLEPSTSATIADDGGSLRCASPPQPDVNYSLVNVGSLTGGSALPPVPRQGIAHQYTADGCASTGTPHQSRCTRRQDLAAFSCCEHDGSRCQAMCLSPVTGLMYSDISPGGQVASAVSYVHAARACDELMMRLCA